MKKVIRLTESDLVRLVKRVVNESFNIPEFEFLDQRKNNSGDTIELFEKKHKGFKIILFTTTKNTPNGDVRIVKVMVQLPGGESINVGQQEFGKDWFVIKDENDGKLNSLIKKAEALGEFKSSWNNAPRLR